MPSRSRDSRSPPSRSSRRTARRAGGDAIRTPCSPNVRPSRRTRAPSRQAGSRSRPESSTTVSTPRLNGVHADGSKVRAREPRAAGVFGSVVHDPATTGLGDVGVGVKWRLARRRPAARRFRRSSRGEISDGRREQGHRHRHDRRVVAADLESLAGPGVDGHQRRLHAPERRRIQRAARTRTLWTVSFGGPAAGQLGWTAECYGYPGTGGPAGQAPIVALLAGPTFLFRKWLALDAGVIVPARGAATARALRGCRL